MRKKDEDKSKSVNKDGAGKELRKGRTVQENRSKTADQRRDYSDNDGFDEADFAFPDEDGDRQTKLQDSENMKGRKKAGLANRNRRNEEENDVMTKIGKVQSNNNNGISSRVQQSRREQPVRN